MRFLCHLVPIAIPALLLGGCFDSFLNGACPPTVVYCCDPATGQTEYGTGRCGLECRAGTYEGTCSVIDHDAGPPTPPVIPPTMPPPAEECEPAAGAAACMESFVTPAGVAFELPVALAACVCTPEPRCDVSVDTDGGQHTLRIRTSLCGLGEESECFTCYEPVARCAVPPLEAGEWDVVVGDAPAFALHVGDVPAPSNPTCITFGDADPCGIGPHLTTRTLSPSRVCRAPGPEGGILRLQHDCPRCGEIQGPCTATLIPRATREAPPGGQILVEMTGHPTLCDVSCFDACFPIERDCRMPVLDVDGLYEIVVHGQVIGSFTHGDGSQECYDVPPIVAG